MDTIQSKTCTKCGADKPLSRFSKNKNGLHATCRSCRNQQKKEWHAKNKELCKVTRRTNYVKNIDARQEYGRKYYEQNVENILPRQRKYKKANATVLSAKKRGTHYSDRYRNAATGYSKDDFRKALEHQKRCCAICGEEFDYIPPHHVCADHDHVSGEKRGVLCRPCNSGLGMFNDSTILLRRAAEYLENPPLRGVL